MPYYQVLVMRGCDYPKVIATKTSMQETQAYIDAIRLDYPDPDLFFFARAEPQIGGTLACLAPILVGASQYAAMIEGLTREGLGRMPDLPPKSGYTCVYPRDDT